MAYLITKIAFLLVLAALAGALMMYAWLKSQYEDVTDGYQLMLGERTSERAELAVHRKEVLGALEERLGDRDSERAALEQHRDAIVEAVRLEVVERLKAHMDEHHAARAEAEKQRQEQLVEVVSRLEALDRERLERVESAVSLLTKEDGELNPLLRSIRSLLDETQVLEVRTVRRTFAAETSPFDVEAEDARSEPS